MVDGSELEAGEQALNLGEQALQLLGEHGFSGAGMAGIYWFLRPSLNAVRNVMGEWTEYHVRNLMRIGEKVQARRETSSDDASTPSSPKVLRDILNEGAWTEDDVQQEYLAGLIMAAGSGGDSVSYFVRLAGGLSTAQTRLHCAIYGALARRHETVDDEVGRIATGTNMWKLNVITDNEDMLEATGLDALNKVGPELMALHREGLLGGYSIKEESARFTASPTPLGALLYTRARGSQVGNPDYFRHSAAVLQRFAEEPPRLSRATVGPIESS